MKCTLRTHTYIIHMHTYMCVYIPIYTLYRVCTVYIYLYVLGCELSSAWDMEVVNFHSWSHSIVFVFGLMEYSLTVMNACIHSVLVHMHVHVYTLLSYDNIRVYFIVLFTGIVWW